MKGIGSYFKTANSVVDDVSEYLIKNFGGIKNITHKSDSHYGIEEDKIANQMYEDFFKEKTPELSLYTEEGERDLKNNLVWVVDPIEGTSNYRAGNPFFATQVCLLENDKPVLAIVNAPILRQKFTAIKGSGAYLNNKKIKPTKLNVLSRALIDQNRGMKNTDKDLSVKILSKIIKKVRTNRIFGSCGLEMCYAAAGITDIFLGSGSQIYDYLPGAFIAKEAGAKVANFKGSEWSILDNNILISNNVLVNDILKLL